MNLLDAVYVPAALVTAPWWARKTRGGWRERFGHTPPLPKRPQAVKRVLIHAVSVGEVNTLRALVPMLAGAGGAADVQVVVSVGTDTGIARARALFGAMPGVWVVRYPLDFSGAVRRFLDAVEPDAVALVELEIWPNFIRACRTRGIPVAVINGRLSARSFRGYVRARSVLRSTFASLAIAAVQDDDYAQRFVAMGVPTDRCRVTGSMKWDSMEVVESGVEVAGAADLARALGIDRSKPVVVAGSTAPMEPGEAGGVGSEEALIAAACPPGVQLVCAPRKPEHFDAAFAALGGANRCVRRSASGEAASAAGKDRFLLDSIGELRLAYALADVAIIGRTFAADLGGSDPIEPVALGKATVVGPNVANFQTAVGTLESAGAIVRAGAGDLGAVLRRLLDDPAERARLGAAGRACIRAQQGATARHAALLRELVGRTGHTPSDR